MVYGNQRSRRWGKNDQEIELTWTLWSVSSFTAPKAVIAIDTLLEDVYYCWYCHHGQMHLVRSCKSKTGRSRLAPVLCSEIVIRQISDLVMLQPSAKFTSDEMPDRNIVGTLEV
jgi:hypothetical protein